MRPPNGTVQPASAAQGPIAGFAADSSAAGSAADAGGPRPSVFTPCLTAATAVGAGLNVIDLITTTRMTVTRMTPLSGRAQVCRPHRNGALPPDPAGRAASAAAAGVRRFGAFRPMGCSFH